MEIQFQWIQNILYGLKSRKFGDLFLMMMEKYNQ